MKLRRGFIKEAEGYACDFRAELGLQEHDPLDPFVLADHLAVPVWTLSSHPNIPTEVKKFFGSNGGNGFSAVTVPMGTFKEIIVNDHHHINRQHSSVAHELGHIILGHPLSPPLIGDSLRQYDSLIEKEANELGFILLVPKPAALHAVEHFRDTKSASEYFGVSRKLLNYRIDRSDARRWAKNREKMTRRS